MYNPYIKLYTRYSNKDWREIAIYLIQNYDLKLCEDMVLNMTRDSKLAIEMSELMGKL